MTEKSAFGRSLRAATSSAKALSAEVFPDGAESQARDGASERSYSDNDDRPQEGLGQSVHETTLQGVAEEAKLCYWCHQPLPPLPEDATYVDEINHYAHGECLEERDERNRGMEQLRAGIAEGSIDSIPEPVRQAVLDRIKASGFSRRCPCLYDPEFGFQGYESHSYSNGNDEVDDYDERNSVKDCRLCGGSGAYDPLPQLLELSDDKAAEAWIVEQLPRSSGPCEPWRGFPDKGWYYDALGYNRAGKHPVRGVTVYNPERMLGHGFNRVSFKKHLKPRRA